MVKSYSSHCISHPCTIEEHHHKKLHPGVARAKHKYAASIIEPEEEMVVDRKDGKTLRFRTDVCPRSNHLRGLQGPADDPTSAACGKKWSN